MYYLGIDIAKKHHVASLVDANGRPVIKTIKFTNDNNGVQRKLLQIVWATLTENRPYRPY